MNEISLAHENTEERVVSTIRRLLLVLLVAGMLGTAVDLMLLAHYESGWQVAPLVALAAGVIVAGWMWVRSGSAALAALRITMVVFIASGALGIVLHYDGNREFQREIDPALRGWPLVVKVLTAKAPPVLAPASMIQLGLLGLLYTYRHPASRWRPPGDPEISRGA